MTTPFEALRGTPNARQVLPALITAGQPSPAQLAAFKAAGGAAVVDIRASFEPRGFNEAEAVHQVGLAYANIPVGTGPLTTGLMEEILAALRAHEGQPVLFHCASGNRTGGPLIAYLMLDHGLEEEDAIMVATQAGLRSAELLTWGVEYARSTARPEP
jgi:protein tyrosine phosphatase (PTP) superfamily phosphohydrolase (DUF442 family)